MDPLALEREGFPERAAWLRSEWEKKVKYFVYDDAYPFRSEYAFDRTAFESSYALAKYQPASVTVTVIKNPGDLTTSATTTTDPNPVFAELQPAGPPPKAHKMRPKGKPTAAASAPADSAFPDPNAAPPPGSR